jgi:hypothetical protein
MLLYVTNIQSGFVTTCKSMLRPVKLGRLFREVGCGPIKGRPCSCQLSALPGQILSGRTKYFFLKIRKHFPAI